MSYPTPKELKKLADACRKAGIKSYKTSEFEFTLSEDAPVSNYKKLKNTPSKSTQLDNSPFQSDEPTPEDVMFWSVGQSANEEILG